MPKSLDLAGYPAYITTNSLNRVPLFADSGNADVVIRALYYCRKAGRIHLLAFVVMPDHLHFIAVLLGEKTLSQLLHSIKSYSSKQINERLRKEGGNWQAGKWEFTMGETPLLLDNRTLIPCPFLTAPTSNSSIPVSRAATSAMRCSTSTARSR